MEERLIEIRSGEITVHVVLAEKVEIPSAPHIDGRIVKASKNARHFVGFRFVQLFAAMKAFGPRSWDLIQLSDEQIPLDKRPPGPSLP